jgi:hypothetical protein
MNFSFKLDIINNIFYIHTLKVSSNCNKNFHSNIRIFIPECLILSYIGIEKLKIIS